MKKLKKQIFYFLILILIFISSQVAITSAENTFIQNNVILPKVARDGINNYFIKKLELSTGNVEKSYINSNEISCNEIQQIFDIGNQNVILVCMENYGGHNGYCLIYNMETNKATRLDILAEDFDSIQIKKSTDSFVVNCRLYDPNKKSSETNTQIYDINTLKLRNKWKSSANKILISIDNDYLFYEADDTMIISSKNDGKEIKQLIPNIGYEVINNSHMLGYDANGVYRLVDLLTQKSKSFPLPKDKAGYGYLSEDNKWLVVLLGKNTKSSYPKYTGELVVINTASSDQKILNVDADNIDTDSITSGDAIFFRNNQVYLSGKTALISINMDSGKVTSKPLVYESITHKQKLGKTDITKIKTLIANYENALIAAINTGKFSLVEPYLTLGSNLYKSQQKLVANLYGKKTQEKLVTFNIQKIYPVNDVLYKVSVVEKIGIKTATQNNFTTKEFRWTYSVNAKNGHFSLSDIEK